MERHLLPGDGFPRRGAGPQYFDRPGGEGEATQRVAGTKPKPPVEAYFRVIDQPVLRLVSVDLKASAEISSIAEVFDFARDYLGLFKAAVIASGIVPPGME